MLKQAIPPQQAEPSAERALATLLDRGNLTAAEAQALFASLVAGELDEAAIAAMLVALRLKGETADELIGAARALRAADVDFPRPDYLFADSCGTGGDGSGSINVSTAVAFVAAAAGLPVAKHGNRSITSRCGSADVLQTLGARLDVTPEQSRRMLDETGFCFIFAPSYHPGLRHAGPVRRRLKVRTIMNLLGPCLNPAEPPVQLLGVADPALLEPIARTLAALGVQRALVVHGSGLDEVALHGPTEAVRLRGSEVERMVFGPEDAGAARASLDGIAGGDPQQNAVRLKTLLLGHGEPAETDLVAMNAAALLMTAELAEDLAEGFSTARELIASGKPGQVLDAYVEASRG